MITALDVFTEIIIVVLPLWFISKNQIKTSKKRVVLFVYSFRLIQAPFSIATIATYFSYLHGERESVDFATTVAWQEIQIGFSLISASIPCLRSFLWAFMSTGLMTIYSNTTTQGSRVTGTHLSLKDKSHGRSAIDSEARDYGQSRPLASRLRPDWQEYQVDVQTQRCNKEKHTRHDADTESGSDKSRWSEQMMVHRDVSFEVEHS